MERCIVEYHGYWWNVLVGGGWITWTVDDKNIATLIKENQ